MTVSVITTRDALRETLRAVSPGFVATMGSLHEGHLALIARSASENPFTVVSVFVNPTQFDDKADLANYPRDLDRDVSLANKAGADLIFAPPVDEIYVPGFDTTVDPGEIATRWEGASRPGHFRGVATVVAILLNLVTPARAYFGEKDYQQLQVIRRMQRDLALPGEIVGCPTVRDVDGLALSSRNLRLSPADRELARHIPRAIDAVQRAAASGEADTQVLEAAGRAVLDVPGVEIDYLAVVEGETLRPIPTLQPGARVIVAVEIGGIRLIDNAEIAGLREPGQ